MHWNVSVKRYIKEVPRRKKNLLNNKTGMAFSEGGKEACLFFCMDLLSLFQCAVQDLLVIPWFRRMKTFAFKIAEGR